MVDQPTRRTFRRTPKPPAGKSPYPAAYEFDRPSGDVSLSTETSVTAAAYTGAMTNAPQARFKLAEVAGMLADPARAAIVLCLMDGSVRPAGELARMAGIAPSTCSGHLRKLVEGGILQVNDQGRHRYLQIANEDVAAMVESLSLHGLRTGPAPVPTKDRALRRARTCYDHLAGELGVAFFEGLRARGGLALTADAVALTQEGESLLRQLALFDEPAPALAGRACVDWTERRFHLGGRLGAWLTTQMFDDGWLKRRATTRRVYATSRGIEGFGALGVTAGTLRG